MDIGILIITTANCLMVICSIFVQCYSIYSHKSKNNTVKFSNISHDGQVTKLHINNFSDEVNVKKGVTFGLGKASMNSSETTRNNYADDYRNNVTDNTKSNKDFTDPINKHNINILHSSVETLKADVQIAMSFAQAFVDTVKFNNESSHSEAHSNPKNKDKIGIETYTTQPLKQQVNKKTTKEYIVTGEQLKEIERLKKKLDQALVKFTSFQDLNEIIGESSNITDE